MQSSEDTVVRARLRRLDLFRQFVRHIFAYADSHAFLYTNNEPGVLLQNP